MAKFRIQPHVRLQEWVAEDEGFFRDEGLDYEFEAAGVRRRGAHRSVQPGDAAPIAVRSGAFEDMEQGRACDVSSACHWAVNAAASGGHGRMWGKAYSVCVSGIFVAPELAVRARPRTSPGVEVGVGYHSGSHYSAIQALEPFLERSDIALELRRAPVRPRAPHAGGRKIEAANVFGAAVLRARAAGLPQARRHHVHHGLPGRAPTRDHEDLERYFRALRRAQREIDLEPERYKHYWLRELPEDLARPRRRAPLRAGRADRVRALHARHVRAHASLDGERGSSSTRANGSRSTKTPCSSRSSLTGAGHAVREHRLEERGELVGRGQRQDVRRRTGPGAPRRRQPPRSMPRTSKMSSPVPSGPARVDLLVVDELERPGLRAGTPPGPRAMSTSSYRCW